MAAGTAAAVLAALAVVVVPSVVRDRAVVPPAGSFDMLRQVVTVGSASGFAPVSYETGRGRQVVRLVSAESGSATVSVYAASRLYLSVERTGRWYLRKSVDGQPQQLAAGFTELPANPWRLIAIGMHGTTITAHINGHQVGTATDGTYASGRVGVGTGWSRAQFDDFTVVP